MLTRPDPPKSGKIVTRPDPTRPDPTRPDPTRPDPTRPDPTRPDPTRPDPTRPDPTRPDPTRPDPRVPSDPWTTLGQGHTIKVTHQDHNVSNNFFGGLYGPQLQEKLSTSHLQQACNFLSLWLSLATEISQNDCLPSFYISSPNI